MTNSVAAPVTSRWPRGHVDFQRRHRGQRAAARPLTVSGPGTKSSSARNTYTGVTTISGGTLQLGNGGATGSIDGTGGVVTNGTLAFNRSDNIVFAPAISGSGGVTQMGPGASVFGTAASCTGPTAINGGTLQAAPPGATTGLVFHFDFKEGAIGTTLPHDEHHGDLERLYDVYVGERRDLSRGKFGVGITTSSGGGIPYVGGFQPAGHAPRRSRR